MHNQASLSKALLAQLSKLKISRLQTPSITRSLAVVIFSIALAACGKNEDVSSTTAPINASSDALDSAASKPVADSSEPKQPTAEPIAVSAVKVGSALDTEKRVLKENTTFGRKDTVYVVVETTGSGKATLTAKWNFIKNGTQTSLEQTTQEINATGPAVTEFHILQNDGWKKGSYLVDVDLNGESVAVKEFRVE